MSATFAHIQLNINYSNIGFYKELMQLAGWNEIHADETIAGYADSNGVSIWFSQAPEGGEHNHSAVGLSHVGIQVDSMELVDMAAQFLKMKNVDCLYDTPKHRPEFAFGDDQTYYQVLFETPDKILVEIMYSGKK